MYSKVTTIQITEIFIRIMGNYRVSSNKFKRCKGSVNNAFIKKVSRKNHLKKSWPTINLWKEALKLLVVFSRNEISLTLIAFLKLLVGFFKNEISLTCRYSSSIKCNFRIIKIGARKISGNLVHLFVCIYIEIVSIYQLLATLNLFKFNTY